MVDQPLQKLLFSSNISYLFGKNKCNNLVPFNSLKETTGVIITYYIEVYSRVRNRSIFKGIFAAAV